MATGAGDALPLPGWLSAKRRREEDGGEPAQVSAPGNKEKEGKGKKEGKGSGRLLKAVARLTLANSRQIAELEGVVYHRFLLLAACGLMAACKRGGQVYEEQSKELRQLRKDGKDPDFKARGPSHLHIFMSMVVFGCSVGEQNQELAAKFRKILDPISKMSHTALGVLVRSFRVKIHREVEGEAQMGHIQWSYAVEVPEGTELRLATEEMVEMQGGSPLPGAAPRGPLEREVGGLVEKEK